VIWTKTERSPGVGEQVLGRWVRLERESPPAGDTARVLDADERAELECLRRENAELRLDRAFLKKVVMTARACTRGDENPHVEASLAAGCLSWMLSVLDADAAW
jgi:transposase-like protein